MEWIKILFSGLWTWLLSVFGKKILREKGESQDGKHTRFKQIQKGRDSSEQEQIFTIDSSASAKCNKEKENNVVIQKQVAGNNSMQTQIGVIKHGH
jgi:hypothetical protein